MSNLTAINSTMQEINDLTDDLYESLVDDDFKSVRDTIKKIYVVLNYVKKSIEEEQEV